MFCNVFAARRSIVVLVGLCTASIACAGISDIVYDVTASNSLGTATYQAKFAQGTFNPGTGIFQWSAPGPVDLVDPDNGNLIATIKGSTTVRSILVEPFGYQVEFGFLATAGDASNPTTFKITSALLDFATLPDPNGRATVVMGVTDNNGDGAALAGLYPGPAATIHKYNGLAPAGATFASLLAGVTAGPGGSSSATAEEPSGSFVKPVGAPVFSISGQMNFTLSSGDTGTGTSNFRILPEPTTLMLLAAGGLMALRRR
jgi:hypothetical protein